MPVYIVENIRTEHKSNHRTWQSAFTMAMKYPDSAEAVVIHEHDADGQRAYNVAGKIIGRDGEYDHGSA